jgi:glyoxylase-like metal-dependent hydrolase (beta-lactamase superfamily II)
VFLHADEPAIWDGKDHAANKTLAAYADRITTVREGNVIAPGLVAWALPGHTAGHMGLRLGDQVVLCADILHSDALQLPDPTAASVYDDDPVQAQHTRRQALDEIADRGLTFSGSHGSHMDKFRKLRRNGAGYEAISL